MKREVLRTANAPQAIGPYSQGIRAVGEFVFLSGQIPLTPEGELVKGSIEDQTRQVMRNIEALLAAAGLGPGNVAKTTIFLSSMDHFAAVNEIYGEFFGPNPPARSTVAVSGLPRGVDVEIETIAIA